MEFESPEPSALSPNTEEGETGGYFWVNPYAQKEEASSGNSSVVKAYSNGGEIGPLVEQRSSLANLFAPNLICSRIPLLVFTSRGPNHP